MNIIYVIKYHITMVEINKMNYVRYLKEGVFSETPSMSASVMWNLYLQFLSPHKVQKAMHGHFSNPIQYRFENIHTHE